MANENDLSKDWAYDYEDPLDVLQNMTAEELAQYLKDQEEDDSNVETLEEVETQNQKDWEYCLEHNLLAD